MSLLTLLKVIKDKHLSANAPPPMRTRAPMRLSQGSAVTISITPLVLAESEGSVFGSDLPSDNKIIAVGQYNLFDTAYYRCYLSQSEGAFLHFAMRGNDAVERRLYRLIDEVDPPTTADWAFWLDENGYIGNPIAQTRPENGGNEYQRTWVPGGQHLPPYKVVETIVDASGATTTVRHQMMPYHRALTDPKLAEHLLVSAAQTDSGMAVNLWLGLDIAASDLTVFASADAPV